MRPARWLVLVWLALATSCDGGDGAGDGPGPGSTTFVLTIDRAGDGSGVVTSAPAGVTCAATACSGAFERGTSVTLTATPDAESRFVGWDGAGCSGTSSCQLVLTAATTVTARFAHGAPGTYAIEVLSYPGGTLLGAAIDARGNVAGTFSASTCCESQVFLYDAATRRVTLPLPDQRNARCVTMSDAGVMLVTLDDGATYRVSQDGETLSVIGAMTPYAMNDRGWVAGWVDAGAGPLHAAVDDGTTVRDLDPGGPVPSTANGINAAGVIVGTRGSKAVVFEAAGPRELAVPPASAALDVSDTGLVVGAADRTFKWTEQAFIADLASGTLTLVDHPSGTVGMSLDRTNRSGTIAVGQLFTSDGAGSGCVRRDGALEPLEPLVELPPGVRILNTVDVNDAGQILVTLVGALGSGGYTAILTPR